MTKTAYRAVKISEHVYWVGAIDWSLRDFHGYATPHGSTYNAFLVLGEKITLIDTVKSQFKDELLARIASVIDPTKIDYIVSNHTEMDHSGCLPDIIAAVKPEKVFASVNGVKGLPQHFRQGLELTAVADGSTLSLGNLTLQFLETKMLHWPDSMFTYLQEDGVLFTSDAFGMHLASSERFDDELAEETLWEGAATYYANILLPYSGLVQKLAEKLTQLNLPLKLVCPDHGPIWRSRIGQIVRRYVTWAEQKRTNKAVIVFDTMWHSTEMLARAIGEGLTDGGTEVKVLSLAGTPRSEVATHVLDAGALLIGSPTLNNNLFPTVADVLTYLKGLRPRNLMGAAFGSYGWGGEAVKQVQEIMTGMGIEMVGDGLRAQYVPDEEALAKAYALGQEISAKLLAKF